MANWKAQINPYLNFLAAISILKGRLSNIYKTTWGEWPSGLRHCSENQEFPGPNPTTHLAGLTDLTLLQVFT